MDDSNPFKRQAEEQRRKRQAEKDAKAVEAAAKAKAKAAAKKKAAQAVEDSWYADGAEDDDTPPHGGGANSDSDDDMGFRMCTSGDQLQGDIPRTGARQSNPGKFKVVNLINFSECDVPEEDAGPPLSLTVQEASSSSSSLFPPMPAAAGSAAYPPQPTPAGPFHNEPNLGIGRQSLSLALPNSLGGMVPGFGGRGSLGGGAAAAVQPPSHNEGALLAEIEHLRQMLADAAEEKAIQVEIVRDEVADKQRALDALQRRQAEEAEALNRATQQLLALQTERDADRDALKVTRAEAEELRAEHDCLRAAANTAASLELAEQKRREEVSVGDAAELGLLRAEVVHLRQAASRQAPQPSVPPSLLADLRAALAGAQAVLEPSLPAPPATPASDGPLEEQLRSLLDASKAVRASAERLSSEKRQAPDGLSNHEAARALREVRQNTERQLAWIAKRIRLSAEAEREASQAARGSVFAVA